MRTEQVRRWLSGLKMPQVVLVPYPVVRRVALAGLGLGLAFGFGLGCFVGDRRGTARAVRLLENPEYVDRVETREVQQVGWPKTTLTTTKRYQLLPDGSEKLVGGSSMGSGVGGGFGGGGVR